MQVIMLHGVNVGEAQPAYALHTALLSLPKL